MIVTQRRPLTDEDKARLRQSRVDWERATEAATAAYRAVAVELMDKSSIRAVAEVTGQSTNTLQRWRNEARR